MSDQDPRVPDMRKREALLIHIIEGLQTTLTKRNQRIAELEELTAGQGQSAFMQQRLAAERKRGWEECADELAGITHELARQLGRVRRDALKTYFDAAKEAKSEADDD